MADQNPDGGRPEPPLKMKTWTEFGSYVLENGPRGVTKFGIQTWRSPLLPFAVCQVPGILFLLLPAVERDHWIKLLTKSGTSIALTTQVLIVFAIGCSGYFILYSISRFLAGPAGIISNMCAFTVNAWRFNDSPKPLTSAEVRAECVAALFGTLPLIVCIVIIFLIEGLYPPIHFQIFKQRLQRDANGYDYLLYGMTIGSIYLWGRYARHQYTRAIATIKHGMSQGCRLQYQKDHFHIVGPDGREHLVGPILGALMAFLEYGSSWWNCGASKVESMDQDLPLGEELPSSHSNKWRSRTKPPTKGRNKPSDSSTARIQSGATLNPEASPNNAVDNSEVPPAPGELS